MILPLSSPDLYPEALELVTFTLYEYKCYNCLKSLLTYLQFGIGGLRLKSR